MSLLLWALLAVSVEDESALSHLTPEKCWGMTSVPEGEFTFGNNHVSETNSRGGRLPGRLLQKSSTAALRMDKCKVTQGQYSYFLEKTKGRRIAWKKLSERAFFPADTLSYENAQEYCAWLGRRLPSEEEWEKAARGGADGWYYWGDDWDSHTEYEWTRDDSNRKRYAVALKKPNPYGLYDMLGIVREMTSGEWDKGCSTLLGRFNCLSGSQYPKQTGSRLAGDLGFRCVDGN